MWGNGVSGTFMSHFQKGIELVTQSSGHKFVKRVALLCESAEDQISQADASNSDNWYRCTYVHMIIVRCNNIVEWRQSTRSYIKHLVDGFERQNDEWCIMYIYVPKPVHTEAEHVADLVEQRKMYRTVQKAFGARDTGEQRCCWLDISPAKNCPSEPRPSGTTSNGGSSAGGGANADAAGGGSGGGGDTEDPVLEELNRKDQALRLHILMDAVSRTFQRRRKKYEREVEILRDDMSSDSWDYCRFFVTCESSAKMFERVHLFEDALHIYDMLEQVDAARTSTRGQWMKGQTLACKKGSAILTPSSRQRAEIKNYSCSRADFMQYVSCSACFVFGCTHTNRHPQNTYDNPSRWFAACCCCCCC